MAVGTYCTLSDLKIRLELTADDPALDDVLDGAIAAASRQIDGMTGDLFYPLVGATFVFDAADADFLALAPSLRTVTSLATDADGDRVYETEWAATDYDPEPGNAPVFGRPYTSLSPAPGGRYAFPRHRRGVRIVGDWGWAAVPDAIRQATLILAHKLVKRADSPLGILATAPDAPGTPVRAGDADAWALLAPYRRLSVVGV